MNELYISPEYDVIRDQTRCINCRVCEKQCANEVHRFDTERQMMVADESKCVNCKRCVSFCPTHALKIVKHEDCFRENANWQEVSRQLLVADMDVEKVNDAYVNTLSWYRSLMSGGK